MDKEAIRIITDYLNERGMWADFMQFADAQGYTVEELGFPDDL